MWVRPANELTSGGSVSSAGVLPQNTARLVKRLSHRILTATAALAYSCNATPFGGRSITPALLSKLMWHEVGHTAYSMFWLTAMAVKSKRTRKTDWLYLWKGKKCILEQKTEPTKPGLLMLEEIREWVTWNRGPNKIVRLRERSTLQEHKRQKVKNKTN